MIAKKDVHKPKHPELADKHGHAVSQVSRLHEATICLETFLLVPY
jgi:hypothetical protein